jgi:hypothetical protein
VFHFNCFEGENGENHALAKEGKLGGLLAWRRTDEDARGAVRYE